MTLSLIIIMLLLSLRSVKLTLVSLLPIIITSVFLYSFLGVTGISLNLMTSTIFSITLGIGIDYAIHFVSVYKYYRQDGNALDKAFKYTSRPILANAFGLAIGMSALMASPLLVHLHVSLLMWVAMITSVLLTLIVIPVVLKHVDPYSKY
jgi:predicted RND superfamily exporter protein